MAEYERCTGCQSFCMQGHQLAINGPDGKREEKNNGDWVQWKNIKSSESTIQTNSTLSAQSQKDLINFIIATYSEGEKCPEKNNIFEDWANKGKITVDMKTTSNTSATSLVEAKKDIEKGGEIQGISSTFDGSIIHASHYNNLLEPLINFYQPVTADPNGEPLQNSNNATKPGPVAGWPGSKTVMVTSGQSDQSEKSLIKASLYNEEGLYAKASKLMYHPYQCNVCNIYEGGEWLEIVDEMWKNLKKDAPPDTGWIYFEHSGTQGYTIMHAGEGKVNARLDCSGCVSAAITLYSIAVGQGANTACQGSYTTHRMGSDWSDPPKLGFTWFDGDGPWQAGDIQVSLAHHTQIVDENVSLAYSGGGETGLNKGGPSSLLNHYVYDGGWRFNGDPGTASGDGSGGFISDTSTDGSGGVSSGKGVLSESDQKKNASIIYNFFTARGWCKTAIAGLCGNIELESGFNPNCHEVGGYGGYGLVQWTPPASDLTNILNKLGLTERNSLQNQLRALYYEYTQGFQWISSYSSTKHYNLEYNHSYEYWAKDDSGNPGLAAQIFMACYERPSYNASINHMAKRAIAAKKWYEFFS